MRCSKQSFYNAVLQDSSSMAEPNYIAAVQLSKKVGELRKSWMRLVDQLLLTWSGVQVSPLNLNITLQNVHLLHLIIIGGGGGGCHKCATHIHTLHRQAGKFVKKQFHP